MLLKGASWDVIDQVAVNFSLDTEPYTVGILLIYLNIHVTAKPLLFYALYWPTSIHHYLETMRVFTHLIYAHLSWQNFDSKTTKQSIIWIQTSFSSVIGSIFRKITTFPRFWRRSPVAYAVELHRSSVVVMIATRVQLQHGGQDLVHGLPLGP